MKSGPDTRYTVFPLPSNAETYKLLGGLIEGLSGMRGGGIRKVSFHSDAMHSSWERREMRGLLVKSKALSLGQPSDL